MLREAWGRPTEKTASHMVGKSPCLSVPPLINALQKTGSYSACAKNMFVKQYPATVVETYRRLLTAKEKLRLRLRCSNTILPEAQGAVLD